MCVILEVFNEAECDMEGEEGKENEEGERMGLRRRSSSSWLVL